jgi:hypothetical protein
VYWNSNLVILPPVLYIYIHTANRELVFGDVDWIHLALDRDRWQAVVNTVMNLQVP